MAGRIRSIKPEILDDEKTAALSHLEWRLFVSMWLIADDHGALRAEPAFLAGQLMWGCPVTQRDVTDAIEGLASIGLIQVYEVRRQRYMQITNWDKHQRVDKPGKPRVPRPDDDGAWSVATRKSDRVYFVRAKDSRAIKIGVSWNPSRRLASLQAGHHETLELIADVAGDTDLERALHEEFAGQRLSGEWFSESDELVAKIAELLEDSESQDYPRETSRESSRDKSRVLDTDLRSPTSDHDPDMSGKPDPDPVLEFSSQAIGEINRISGRQFEAHSKANQKLCRALIRNKHTADEAMLVIQSKASWVGDPKMTGYFQPATLLGPEKFERYLDEARAGPPRSAGPNGARIQRFASTTTDDEPDLSGYPRITDA